MQNAARHSSSGKDEYYSPFGTIPTALSQSLSSQPAGQDQSLTGSQRKSTAVATTTEPSTVSATVAEIKIIVTPPSDLPQTPLRGTVAKPLNTQELLLQVPSKADIDDASDDDEDEEDEESETCYEEPDYYVPPHYVNGNGFIARPISDMLCHAAVRRDTTCKRSSALLRDSQFDSCCLMLGAGMVIIQPSTDKIVLVQDTDPRRDPHWFLPKGRKDVGESLEEAACREAYEETGYVVKPFPLFMSTNAPPYYKSQQPVTEAIYVSTHAMLKRGIQYLVFWYIGQITDDAVREEGTGMKDEQYYQAHLVTYEEAVNRVESKTQRGIIQYAWKIYCKNRQLQEECKTGDGLKQVEDSTPSPESMGSPRSDFSG